MHVLLDLFRLVGFVGALVFLGCGVVVFVAETRRRRPWWREERHQDWRRRW